MRTPSPANPLANPWVIWHSSFNDPLALLRAARRGVPVEAAFAVANAFQLPTRGLEDLFELSTKTLRLYLSEKKPLSAVNSEKTLRLMALHTLGAEVFGEPDAFLRWLNKPAHGLDQEVPLDLLATTGGIDLVIEELRRIAHGDLS